MTNLYRSSYELINFCSNVLPKLSANQCFIVMLAARNKYLTDEQKAVYSLKKHHDMLNRVLVRSNSIEALQGAINELQPISGRYLDSKGNDIPENAFVYYITPNPKDIKKACKPLITKLLDVMEYDLPRIDLEEMVLTEIHKSKSIEIYFDLDVDLKIPLVTAKDLLETITSILTVHTFIRTKNGFHFLFKTDEQQCLDWWKQIHDLGERCRSSGTADLELKRDCFVPIPGTLQGGNLVKCSSTLSDLL